MKDQSITDQNIWLSDKNDIYLRANIAIIPGHYYNTEYL